MQTKSLFASIAAAVLLCGCSSNGEAGTPSSVQYQQRVTAGQAISLEVDGAIGVDLSVTPSSDGMVSFAAERVRGLSGLQLTHVSDPQWLRLRLDPSSHVVRPRWLFGGGTEAKIDLAVPANATLSVQAVNGPVRTDGIRGPLAVHIVNGPISIEGAGSVLSLHLVNGPIDVDIADQSQTPNIDIRGTNGSIDVTVPKNFAAMVDAHTVVGPLDEHLTGLPGPGSMNVHLVAGPISIEER